MGDAAATAHFSVGSGTKLALESAIALADYLHTEPTCAAAFRRYEDERRTEVLRLQSAARNSTEWFEEVERYLASRSGAVQLLAADALAAHQPREPARCATRRGSTAPRCGSRSRRRARSRNARAPPMFTPFRLRDLRARRTASSSRRWRSTAPSTARRPTGTSCTTPSAPRAAPAWSITEMTCVSPEGRISPGCTGLYAPEHEAAWKRIVDFVHAETDAKIAHPARPFGAEGLDAARLGDDGRAAAGRQLAGDGAVAGARGRRRNQVPREMTRADMDAVRDAVRARRPRWPSAPASTCSSCTARTATCCRRSSRRSPTAARDAYGGSLENRMRFPLEVFHAVRAVWPADKPISVRISANDWVGDEGVTPEDAVEIARLLQAAGVDIIDVSAGQTSTRAQPGLRPHVPDAVLRPHPQRDRHRHDGGRQHLRARPRQLDPDGGPRRPVLPGAAASRRSLLDAARRGAARLPRRDLAQALSARAATSCTGWPRAPNQPTEKV